MKKSSHPARDSLYVPIIRSQLTCASLSFSTRLSLSEYLIQGTMCKYLFKVSLL